MTTTQSKRYRDLSPFPRDARVFNDSYSFYIKIIKRIFPIAAFVLVGIVFLWSHIDDFFNTPSKVKTLLAPKVAVENYLIEPSFTTTDAQNRPVDIKADYAIQSFEDKTAQLSKPNTHFQINPETSVTIQSKSGFFDETNNQLSYQDAVVLETSNGYNIKTDEATVTIQEKIAEGSLPVKGNGPTGDFTAEGFRVSEGGKKIELRGKSKLSLKPKKKDGA
ncbi:MAG: LPS export ABC transporter periplasmic protein LptC [Candidatus Nucleicultricaceae bacterium]